jgi:DNA-binding response OmpR family regulator
MLPQSFSPAARYVEVTRRHRETRELPPRRRERVDPAAVAPLPPGPCFGNNTPRHEEECATAMKRRTALVVEDEPDVADLEARILRLRQIEPTVLYGGGSAPQWVREHHPDLVLLDLMLPDRDGYSVCEAIKLDRQTNLTPVVMVTGRTRHEDLLRGLTVGANEYVTKPFDIETLNEAVGRALEWRDALARSGTRGEVHFQLRSDTKFLEELNAMLSSLFLHTGLSEDAACQLTTAVREMGSNAIEWGHRRNVDMLVTVTYRIGADRIVIRIRDSGPGFKPGQLPHAADADDPIKHMDLRESLGLRAGGFGILMTRGLVDEQAYNETGNEVSLV